MSSAWIPRAAIYCGAACVCVLFGTQLVHAQADLTATFDEDLEGWLAVDYPYYTHSSSPATWEAFFDNENGVLPGSLRIGDVFGETGITAPAEWLGDKAAYYGGYLAYDILIRETDNVGWTAVTLNAGTFSLYRETPPPPLGEWERRTIPLTEECWYDNATRTPADRERFLYALSHLTGLYIATEWRTGPDDTNVDNIVLSATTTRTTTPADFNADSKVNLDDVAIFRLCAGGPNLPYAPGCPLPVKCGGVAADFDHDGDVDQSDFGHLQHCFKGNQPADPECDL